MENLGQRLELISWLRYAILDQHRQTCIQRFQAKVKEGELERERGRECER